ncbi:hypothetical protein [Sphingobacterium sp. LRF_L2]|uniref:hypothetical protein n=1 Tax=Sphingobacterium sp. LRF_L2 TaxID=3369421 RepID=UPI003F62FF82
MKSYCFFGAIFVFLVISCKDNVVQPLTEERISMIVETNVETVNEGTQSMTVSEERTHDFRYDTQGRLSKVGDKVFIYGSDGRVAYTRQAHESEDAVSAYIYVEKLRYIWDNQGRLKEIVIDSLLQESKSFISEENRWKSVHRELKTDGTLTTFNYTGSSDLPATVRYRKLKVAAPYSVGLSGLVLGPEEVLTYEYDGDQVHRIKSVLNTGNYSSSLGDILSGELLTTFQFLQYEDTPNPLFKIYQAIGFHPYRSEEVVSRYLPHNVQLQAFMGEYNQTVIPDWDNSVEVHVVTNADGNPTEFSYGLQSLDGSIFKGHLTKIVYE